MPKVKRLRDAAIHPKSRKAAQLTRKSHHDDRVNKRIKEKTQKLGTLGEKLLWFQSHLNDDQSSYTKAEACGLVERYLDRFKDELEQISLVNSMKGRSNVHASRAQVIAMTMETEKAQYLSSGFEIPDIVNAKALNAFRAWGGELKYIPNLKMRRVTIADATQTNNDISQKDSKPEHSVTEDSVSRMDNEEGYDSESEISDLDDTVAD